MRTANNQENLCERKRERGGGGGRESKREGVRECDGTERESVMKRKEERNKKESRDALINTDDT